MVRCNVVQVVCGSDFGGGFACKNTKNKEIHEYLMIPFLMAIAGYSMEQIIFQFVTKRRSKIQFLFNKKDVNCGYQS